MLIQYVTKSEEEDELVFTQSSALTYPSYATKMARGNRNKNHHELDRTKEADDKVDALCVISQIDRLVLHCANQTTT